MLDLDELDTLGKLYAAHNKLHGNYVDARWGARKKADMQEDHAALVGKIKELGGKHLPKGEALDETLPDNLKEAVKLRYMTDSIVLDELEGTIHSTIQVLRTGTFYHPAYGKFTIDAATLETMANNFSTKRPKAPTEMVVDWEHMSVAEPPVVAPAAGWVRNVFTDDGRLMATVEWNDEAVTQIRNKQYKFVSPEIDLNYRDKETNQDIGPTLLSVALTNRPFLEGMAPVVLSSELASMLFTEESFYEQEDAIRSAYYAQFAPSGEYGTGGPWVRDAYDEYIIIEEGGKLYRLPYTKEDTDIVFDTVNKVEVQKLTTYLELAELAEWDTAYINDLPDSSFAYIAPDGEKDEDGKTIPRSLRHLPYKDAGGKVDLPHLRNALARLPQTNLSAEAKAEARRVLVSAAQEAGVGEYSDNLNEGGIRMDAEQLKQLRELLELGEEDDIVEAITTLKAKADDDAAKLTEADTKATTAEARATEAETKLATNEAGAIVDKALAERKITPKMKEWALAYVLADRNGFAAYVEAAEVVGPPAGEKGSEAGADKTEPTEMQLKLAEKLGVTREELVKALAKEQGKD